MLVGWSDLKLTKLGLFEASIEHVMSQLNYHLFTVCEQVPVQLLKQFVQLVLHYAVVNL